MDYLWRSSLRLWCQAGALTRNPSGPMVITSWVQIETAMDVSVLPVIPGVPAQIVVRGPGNWRRRLVSKILLMPLQNTVVNSP